MKNLSTATQQWQGTEFLIEASQKLVPWWSYDTKDVLKMQTEQNTTSSLDSYYLFPLDEISISSDCTDIPKFINERFHNILAAANYSGLSVALILSYKNGSHRVFLGFKDETTEEEKNNNPNIFKSIVNGLLPGKKIALEESVRISKLTEGYSYGGMITGVPTLKNSEGRQNFNLSSIVRSLYGKEYFLAIISKPVTETEKQYAFRELLNTRDMLHALAKQTRGKDEGTSDSTTSTVTEGSAKTKGHNIGSTLGVGIPIPNLLGGGGSTSNPVGGGGSTSNLFLALGGSYGYNWSNTENKSTSKADTHAVMQSDSLSFEQQNGVALELEKIAEQYVERMIQGFNSGYWETAITFATQDKISSKVLAGTFTGELSKPNNTLLPPPRIYLDSLEDKTLFIPKSNSSNPFFPKALASYITSEELALLSSPPTESIYGYEIQKMPMLALTDTGGTSEIKLGCITDYGNPIPDAHLHLSKSDLNKHLFICGLTGSGKTTTVKHILQELAQKENTPFLVLESAKRDYRQLLGNSIFKENLNIFTMGDATVSPIRFNPFYIQEGVHPLEHIDYLKAIFNASFSLYGPMPSIVEKCLHNIYIKKGWDLTLGTHPNFVDNKGYCNEERYQLEEHYYCFPTLTDLKNEIDQYIKTELDYKGELRDNIRTAIIVRIESLCVGAKGLMFNTYDFFPLEKLLSANTILEMESLADDDDKAFFVGLILVLISEYRQKENPAVNPGMGNKGLQHVMVIEEAHRLLKNVETERTTEMMGNPKGKAVEVFCNILSEMRSLGQGVAVVEQIPSKISPDVIKNSNTKIVHRLVARDDQSLLAGSLSIDDNDALYLNRLKTGHALCHKEGMGKPVECIILNDVASHAISNDKVNRTMETRQSATLHNYLSYQIDSWLGDDGKEIAIKLLHSLTLEKPETWGKLLHTANNEIKKLLIFKNIPYPIEESYFADYFTLQIMKLLSKGLYSRRKPMPANLKDTLFNILQETEEESKKQLEESKKQLIQSLNNLWLPDDSTFFIEDVILNLICQLYKNNPELSIASLRTRVSAHLLVNNEKIVDKISQRILSRIGKFHD